MIKLKLDLSVIRVPIISLLWVGWWGVPQTGNSFVKIWFCQLLEANPAHGPRSIWASWWASSTARKTSQGDQSVSLQHIQRPGLCFCCWTRLFGAKNTLRKIEVFVQTRKLDTEGTFLILWTKSPTKPDFFALEILHEFDFIPFWEVTVPSVQQLQHFYEMNSHSAVSSSINPGIKFGCMQLQPEQVSSSATAPQHPDHTWCAGPD